MVTCSAQLVQVIETVSVVGTGSGPEDPVRNALSYWTTSGELIACIDPVENPGLHKKLIKRKG